MYETAAAAHGLRVTNYQNIWSFDPGVFNATTVSCVQKAARIMGFSCDRLCSHTGELNSFSSNLYF
jgi:hypothetical protein